MNFSNSEHTSFSFHESQSSKSLIVSQKISENVQKYSGPGAPPKVILKEMIIYQISSIFTLTSDCLAKGAYRCNRLYTDFRSSFLINIFLIGNSCRSTTI